MQTSIENSRFKEKLNESTFNPIKVIEQYSNLCKEDLQNYEEMISQSKQLYEDTYQDELIEENFLNEAEDEVLLSNSLIKECINQNKQIKRNPIEKQEQEVEKINYKYQIYLDIMDEMKSISDNNWKVY